MCDIILIKRWLTISVEMDSQGRSGATWDSAKLRSGLVGSPVLLVDLLPLLFPSSSSSTQSFLTLSPLNMSSPPSDLNPQYAEGYDDPTADLVIECEDGLMRVHSYLFMAHRQVAFCIQKHMADPSPNFRDTPPQLVIRTDTGERFVVFDCMTSHIDDFLRFLRKDTELQPYSWEELQSVLCNGETGQFVHIPDLVRPHVYSLVNGTTAWEIAVFAGSNDYQDIFKLAIAALRDRNWCQRGQDEMPMSCLDLLPLKYATALVIAMHKHQHHYSVTEQERWRNISDSFVVKED
jgi:hypothetical protein